MKINKLTEAKSLSEVGSFFSERSMTKGNVNQKIKYFTDNNSQGQYDTLLEWLTSYWESLPDKEKVTPEEAYNLLQEYGATKAVKVLAEEGVSITRQGLYKARGKYCE